METGRGSLYKINGLSDPPVRFYVGWWEGNTGFVVCMGGLDLDLNAGPRRG